MRQFLASLCACALACISLAAENPPPEPVWNSIPEAWRGELVATREWNDSAGKPQRLKLRRREDGTCFYILHAISSVCGDAGKEASCRLHLFSVCFTETGHFLGYQVGRENPFTRAKHEPFAPDDYKLLDRILRDPIHVLSTIKEQADGLDVVSGATIQYVAEQSVPGAYYTSKAVWTIAQRTGPAKVQAWTLERASADDVRAWQAKRETLTLWWFLDHAEKSGLAGDARTDLVYGLLDYPQPDVQAAAIRYLHRTNAPFQPARAQSDRYAGLDDSVKPDFLAWWRRHKHAPEPLVEAVLTDLRERVEKYSPVTAHALDFLSAMNRTREERCREVLQMLTEKSPSTYIRKFAGKLLEERP